MSRMRTLPEESAVPCSLCPPLTGTRAPAGRPHGPHSSRRCWPRSERRTLRLPWGRHLRGPRRSRPPRSGPPTSWPGMLRLAAQGQRGLRRGPRRMQAPQAAPRLSPAQHRVRSQMLVQRPGTATVSPASPAAAPSTLPPASLGSAAGHRAWRSRPRCSRPGVRRRSSQRASPSRIPSWILQCRSLRPFGRCRQPPAVWLTSGTRTTTRTELVLLRVGGSSGDSA
mmetsp:Transcript_45564/g.142947  ORF Transcript_45564/g.142947 Transcript_45564/m.142947 type:complete len:225 (-) Transcript_45564:137-811(-)